MTDVSERLSEIRERVEAATEGPWDMVEATEGKRAVVGHLPPENVRIADVGDRGTSVEERNADAAFIASARSDVPYLLSLVEEVGEALDGIYEYDSRWRTVLFNAQQTARLTEEQVELLTALRDAAQEGAE